MRPDVRNEFEPEWPNEFLKEHRKVEQQRKDFEAAIARQQKQIDALTAGLQEEGAPPEFRKNTPPNGEDKQETPPPHPPDPFISPRQPPALCHWLKLALT